MVSPAPTGRVVRPLRGGDVARVHALFVGEGELSEYAQQSLESPNLYGWIAEIDGAVVGAILTHLMQSERRGGIDELLVATSHRSNGIGRALMNAAEEHYRAQGAGGMQLTVREDNAPAEQLYASLGYTTVQRRLRMWKDF